MSQPKQPDPNLAAYERGWHDGYKLAAEKQVALMKKYYEEKIKELEKQVRHWKEIAQR